MKTVIGVLAAQGAFELHQNILESLGAEVVQVRSPEHLAGLNGLVLPGGESTVMGKMLERWNLLQPLMQRIIDKLPVMGVCAGLILLAKHLYVPCKDGAARLETLDVTIERNAYGRQINSFEAVIDLELIGMGSPPQYRAVFIRAPVIREVGENVQVLARFENKPVLVRQDAMLGASFHPELSGSYWLHEWFLKEIVH